MDKQVIVNERKAHASQIHHLDMYFNFKESTAEDRQMLVAVFPFKAFSNVLEDWSYAKNKTNKTQVSVQYFFITWQHDSRGVLFYLFFFGPQHLPAAGTGVLFSDMPISAWVCPQVHRIEVPENTSRTVSLSPYTRNQEESGKIIFKKTFIRMIELILTVKYNLVLL